MEGAHVLRTARPGAQLRQGRTDWYRIEAKDDSDTAEVYLYDEIGGWWGTTAQQFVDDLRQVTSSQIDLHIDSPGGDVFDGIAIYNALLDHQAHVEVYVDGLAASAASFIAQAGDRVVMNRASQMMIHKAFGLCIGNDDDMEQMRDVLRRISSNIAAIYAARSGVGDADSWLEAMTAETWYSAEEAVQAGLADQAQATPKRGDQQPAQDRWDLSVFKHPGRERAPRPSTPPAARRRPPGPGSAIPTAAVLDTACPTHHTDTVDPGGWDAGANEKRLSSPMPVATARKAYGYYDSARVEDGEIVKDGCKLLHHEVSADGTPGAAHLGGVRNALSRLPQSDVPEGEHPAVERHLNAHLDDAPQEDGAADVLAGLPDELFAGLGDALDELFDPVGGYDPRTLASTIADVYADAAAPPATPPRPEPPRTAITIDEMITAIQEGVRP